MEALVTGILSFASTNIDDIFILMLFFSETAPSFGTRHIVWGQYLGFIALLLVSFIGFLGSFVIPREWLGLLGLIPMGIGVGKFWKQKKGQEEIKNLPVGDSLSCSRMLGSMFHRKTYAVAAVTFANGGDNLGLYIPLFASSGIYDLTIISIVFLILVALWCWMGYRLARHPGVGQTLSAYGHILLPVVFIGLGGYIVVKNGTLTLFGL